MIEQFLGEEVNCDNDVLFQCLNFEPQDPLVKVENILSPLLPRNLDVFNDSIR
jgi:hypothetical protein